MLLVDNLMIFTTKHAIGIKHQLSSWKTFQSNDSMNRTSWGCWPAALEQFTSGDVGADCRNAAQQL